MVFNDDRHEIEVKPMKDIEQAERLIFVAKCVTAVNVLIGILQLITLWKVLQ